MASASLRFQGLGWLLLEPKTAFYSPRYSQDSICVRRQVLPFWTQPQLVLQVGLTEYLVLSARPEDACRRSGDPKETKKLLQLTVRPLDDVRRAQLYQTAARAQVLEVFVDVEHTRERLLRCLRGQDLEKDVDPTGKRLLDDAFMTLERAQQGQDSETAIELYEEAERGFWKAERLLTDDRSRELVRARRRDLQNTIRKLEKEVKKTVNVTQNSLPVAPVVPQPQAEVVAAPPPMDIRARLEELRRFAALSDAHAHQDNRTDPAARLAALKNEKVGAAPIVDDLVERLRRLKGESGSSKSVSLVRENDLERKSAVDRIIEQVTDEIALGIEDNEIEDEDLEESDSKSGSASSINSSIGSNKSKTENSGGFSRMKK